MVFGRPENGFRAPASPDGTGNPSNRRAAKQPTGLKGFLSFRGRLDPKSRRLPVGSKSCIKDQTATVRLAFSVLDLAAPPPKPSLGGSESGPLGPGEAWLFEGLSTNWSPDRRAELEDNFGHPEDVQVKVLNSRYQDWITPLTS